MMRRKIKLFITCAYCCMKTSMGYYLIIILFHFSQTLTLSQITRIEILQLQLIKIVHLELRILPPPATELLRIQLKKKIEKN